MGQRHHIFIRQVSDPDRVGDVRRLTSQVNEKRGAVAAREGVDADVAGGVLALQLGPSKYENKLNEFRKVISFSFSLT